MSSQQFKSNNNLRRCFLQTRKCTRFSLTFIFAVSFVFKSHLNCTQISSTENIKSQQKSLSCVSKHSLYTFFCPVSFTVIFAVLLLLLNNNSFNSSFTKQKLNTSLERFNRIKTFDNAIMCMKRFKSMVLLENVYSFVQNVKN